MIMFVLSVGTIFGLKQHNQTKQFSELQLANAEALANIEQIGDKWYYVDKIPCASCGAEMRLDCSYVNCQTCLREAGKAISEEGECTNVREFNP